MYMIGGAAERMVYYAASREDVARFYQLVSEDPFLINEASFTGSRNLLHVATLCGQAGIVEAALKTCPRLARSLDSQKWSPLHIAAAEGHLEIAKKLLSVAPETCWSRDRQGMNPVHIAAMKGNLEILKEMFELDYLPAMERAHRGQTVLHLCVKRRQLAALEFLVEAMADEFVSAKDDDGDTALHWAVRSIQIEMVQCLVGSGKIDKEAKNAMGKTASNILTEGSRNYSEMRRMLWFPAVFEIVALPDMIMVVVALIASVAYQTAVSPPGGVWQDDSATHRAGEAVMASTRPETYKQIVVHNMRAFVTSFMTIVILSTGFLFSKSIPIQGAAMVCMLFSMISMISSYALSLEGVNPQKKKELEYSLTDLVLPSFTLISCIFVSLFYYKCFLRIFWGWLAIKKIRPTGRSHVRANA